MEWLTKILEWLTANDTDALLTGIAAAVASKHTLIAGSVSVLLVVFAWPWVRLALRKYTSWTPFKDDDDLPDKLDAFVKDKVRAELGLSPVSPNAETHK